MSRVNFNQTYTDATELQTISNAYSGKREVVVSLEDASVWFNLRSDLRYVYELQRTRNMHRVVLNHVCNELSTALSANQLLTFIAIMNEGTTVSEALEMAVISVVTQRAGLLPDMVDRARAALLCMYEFSPEDEQKLDYLLKVSSAR